MIRYSLAAMTVLCVAAATQAAPVSPDSLGNLQLWLQQANTNFDGTIDTDLSDNEVARAPDWTANVDFLYNHSLMGGTMDWLLNVNYEDEAVYA